MSENVVYGVPSTVLLPSKREKWEFVSGPHPIDVGLGTLDEGDIVTYDVAEDVHTLVDLGNLTKALYVSESYPALEEGCVFSIRNLLVNRDTKVVTVVGNVFKKA